MNRRARLLLGFLFAPLGPQVVIAYVSITQGATRFDRMYAVWALVASYFLMLTSGIATYWIREWRRRHTRLDYMLTGGAVGIVWGMLAVLGLRLLSLAKGMTDTFTIDTLIAIGIVGGALMVIISTFFWLIARPDRP